MNDFFLSASGVDQKLLAQVPHERSKYAGVGIALVVTAAVAGFTSTFTFYSILHVPLVLALGLGALWGAMIFGLDRALVTTWVRQPKKRHTLLLAIPRVLLAVVIAYTVATPVVLQVFDSEVQQELVELRREDSAAFEQELASDSRFATIPEREERLATLRSQILDGVSEAEVLADARVALLQGQLATVSAAYDLAEGAVVCENEGTCGSGTVGRGPAYTEKVAVRDRTLAQLGEVKADLAVATTEARTRLGNAYTAGLSTQEDEARQLSAALQRDKDRRAAEVDAHQEKTDGADGFLIRLEALERVTANDSSAGAWKFSLEALFFLIELLPLAIKLAMLLGKPSDYDDLVTVQGLFTEGQARVALQAEHEQERLRRALDIQRTELDVAAEVYARQEGATRLREHKAEWERREADRWNEQRLTEEALVAERATAEAAEELTRQAARVRAAEEPADRAGGDGWYETAAGPPVPSAPVQVDGPRHRPVDLRKYPQGGPTVIRVRP